MKTKLLSLLMFILTVSINSQTLFTSSEVVTEGTDTKVTITISLDVVATTNVIAQVSPIDATADSSDFDPTVLNLTLLAGQLSTTIDVPIIDDNIYEATETFSVVAQVTSANTTNTSATGIITILDDSLDIPSIFLGDVVVTEGTDPFAIIPVSLSNQSATDVVVTINATSGTAITDDYVETEVIVIILAGDTAATVSIGIVDDALVEGTESFTVVGSSPDALTSAPATITILDNEPTASQTTIVSAAFETYLETHDANGQIVALGAANSLGDGTDGNNLVPTAKIDVVTRLALYFLGIDDLTGLEDFAALEVFTMQGNSTTLTNVNFTANTNLKEVRVQGFTNLNTFNVTNLNNLEIIALTSSNNITALDFTSNTSLADLFVTTLPNLVSLNISGLTNLTNVNLADSNSITSLDFSSLVALDLLIINRYSQLTSLNIKTGNTASIGFVRLSNNALLNCVTVDAGIPANGLSTWNAANTAVFDEFCSQDLVYVPDNNFENYLETHDATGTIVALGAATSMGNGIANDDKVFLNSINAVVNLNVQGLSIADLRGIRGFSSIIELNANNNIISTVDVSLNSTLEKLYLDDNSLSFIDVSSNTMLTDLSLKNNSIKSINVSNNLQLDLLDITGNVVESLDVSLNTALSHFQFSNNNLSVLDMQTGYSVSSFDARNNTNLTCIEVIDTSFWDLNYGTQIDTQTSFSLNCNYPVTTLVDPVFENYLETHDKDGNAVILGDVTSMGNGIANDQYVFTHRINTVKLLDISNTGVTNLAGLEDFRDLEVFGSFGGNQSLITADFSSNLKLKRITFSFVSAATSVTFGNLPDVEYIQLGFNNITSVDISGLPNLVEFKEFGGSLTSLDTSGNPNLKILTLQNTPIVNIDLSNNTELETLNFNNSLVTDLDLSSNSKLKQLNINGGQLESLDLQNGGNTLLLSNSLDIRNNANLTCIQVDDVSYSSANWTNIDAQHVFNTDCSAVWTINTSATTLTALLAITPSVDTDNSGDITLAEAAAYVGTLDLSGQGLTDVEGLQAFTGISVLDISGNSITDLSPLTGITATIIQRNSNASQSAAAGFMALEELLVSGNNLEAVDLSDLPDLKVVDLSNNPDLVTVTFQNGNNANITSFNATNSPKLTCVLVDNPNASYLSSWSIDPTANFVADDNECLGVVLNVEDLELDNSVSIYPNPVSTIININVSGNLQIKEINIINLLGKTVKKTNLRNIDVSSLSNGMYILQIQTDKGFISKKIIKN